MGKAKRIASLGFRDLECHQGWRLIQNPDSLVAKVLKEKYFPNGNFFDTPIEQNALICIAKYLECENFA